MGEIIQIDSAHVELLDGRFILSMGYVRLLGIGEVWLSRIMVRRARVFFCKRCSTKRRSKCKRNKQTKAFKFRGDFEIAVKNCSLGFFYLPHKSPKLNPHVEWVNPTSLVDFYQMYEFNNHSIEQINRLVEVYANEYNSHCYHQSLAMKTALAYLKRLRLSHNAKNARRFIVSSGYSEHIG